MNEAQLGPSDSGLSRSLHYARLAQRTLYATLLVFMAAAGGWLLGDRVFSWISENQDRLPWGLSRDSASLTLSLGLILSTAQKLLLSIRKFWDFIHEGEAPELYPDGLQLLFVALSLNLAYLASFSEPISAQDVLSPSVLFVERTESAHEAIAIPVFRFPRARWDWSSKRLSESVGLPPEAPESLAEFLRALSGACGRNGNGELALKVQGFASGLPFKGFGREESENLNLQAANQRASVTDKALRNALQKLDVGGRVEILPAVEWTSYQQMADERDRLFSLKLLPEPEDSHRVAVILVEKSGSCEVRWEHRGRGATASPRRG
jgi:hypothetical protein